MERNNILEIPEDILTKIMLRVPLESLVKCICVCKNWSSTIRGEGFKNLYWDQSMTRPRLLFRYCEFPGKQPPNKLFHTVYQQEKPLLSSGLKQMPISSLPPEYEMISSPQRGLVCLRSENKFVLCNPGTNKFKALPECKPILEKAKRACFFGYDEVTKIFKLLVSDFDLITGGGPTEMTHHQVFTFTLAEIIQNSSFEDKSWRWIVCQHPYSPVTESLCLNGVLYYAAQSLVEIDQFILMSFNVTSEEFHIFDLPDQVVSGCDRLVNYNGKVCLVQKSSGNYLNDDSREFELYVKDESGSKWREELVVIPAWRDTVGGILFYFHGTIGTGELVFATWVLRERSHFMLYYDTSTRSLRKFKVQGVDGSSYCFVQTFLNHYDSLLLT